MQEKRNPGETVILITAPAEDEAASIAHALVKEKLAACVNIIRNIRSVYTWQGNVEDDTEVLLIVKTRKDLFDAVSEKVKELHEYEVPEIITLPIVNGLKDYLDWIHDSTA